MFAARRRGRSRRRALGVLADGFAREGPDRAAELRRASNPVTAPERHRAGDAGRGDDDHPVAGDVLDPPRGRAEQEGLPRARLVDHLLVELADAAPVGEVHAVKASIGDRSRIGDCELARALAPTNDAGGAVPDDARAQLGELLRRIAAVEHVEDVLQLLAGELGERLGRGDELLDRVKLPLAVGDHRDEVLGEHIQRVARDHRLLDLTPAHAPGDHSALEQVGAELGEDPALRDLSHLVPSAADALDSAGDRLRRLDLDHEVHRAHVNAELERARGRHEAGELA